MKSNVVFKETNTSDSTATDKTESFIFFGYVKWRAGQPERRYLEYNRNLCYMSMQIYIISLKKFNDELFDGCSVLHHLSTYGHPS